MIKKHHFYFLLSFLTLISCKDKVQEFSGFNQKELEFLLASYEGKIWERISREENGEEIVFEDCELDNYLIFLEENVNNAGELKPLLYAYNPNLCDSLDFCSLHPDFCLSDTTLCAENPDFCENLEEGILFIGSWYAKEPFIENSRSDTLVFEINNKAESIQVLDVTANYVTFLYKNRTGTSGGTVIEHYQFLPPTTE
jgi:hypothetical protein